MAQRENINVVTAATSSPGCRHRDLQEDLSDPGINNICFLRSLLPRNPYLMKNVIIVY